MKQRYLILTLIVYLFNVIVIKAQVQSGNTLFGEDYSNYFGNAVSLSGDGQKMAIGAYGNSDGAFNGGQVRVYAWDGTDWYQEGADIDGIADNDLSGWSVSLSDDGNTVAIGVPYHDFAAFEPNTGYVKVMQWNGSEWIQMGSDVHGISANGEFGWSVSLSSDGTRFAAGADYGNGLVAFTGHTRIFEWNGIDWVQMGATINGENSNDQSGYSVALSGNGEVVAIGAPNNNGNGAYAGNVRVFSWNGSEWMQRATDIDAEAAGDLSGWSVSISEDGNVVAIGALNNDGNGFESGHVRVFAWDGVNMSQKGTDIDGTATGDLSGESVSLSADGNWVIIGSKYYNGASADEGQARIFSWNGSDWNQIGTDINGEEPYENFGHTVSISDDKSTVAVASILDNSFTGYVKIFNMAEFLADVSIIADLDFSISPNPVNGMLTITAANNHDYRLSVFNVQGNLMVEQKINAQTEQVNMANYSQGLYILRITHDDIIISKSVIVE